MNYSIVIPAYNEEDNLEKVLEDCLGAFGLEAEIIVVNDASTDKTHDIIQNSFTGVNIKEITNAENLGHAKSLLKGLMAATKEKILYIDADGQIKPDAMDFNFISGYRVHRQDKFFRKVVSFILKMIIWIRHGYYIRDANCPFKIIDKRDLYYLLSHLPNDCVVPTICLSILARRLKFRVCEVPVEHFPLAKPRKGFLQSLNKKSLSMFYKAFKEVWNI